MRFRSPEAAQEERFSRRKPDPGFPANASRYRLEEAGLSLDQIDQVVFYDKPLVKFERLLETYLAYAPAGFQSFLSSMPVWLNDKLFLKARCAKSWRLWRGAMPAQIQSCRRCFSPPVTGRMRHRHFFRAPMRKPLC